MFDIHVVIPYTKLYMIDIKNKLTDKYKLTNVVTIDCGKNIAYYYNPMENKKESSKDHQWASPWVQMKENKKESARDHQWVSPWVQMKEKKKERQRD